MCVCVLGSLGMCMAHQTKGGIMCLVVAMGRCGLWLHTGGGGCLYRVSDAAADLGSWGHTFVAQCRVKPLAQPTCVCAGLSQHVGGMSECLLHVSTFATTRVALLTGVEPGKFTKENLHQYIYQRNFRSHHYIYQRNFRRDLCCNSQPFCGVAAQGLGVGGIFAGLHKLLGSPGDISVSIAFMRKARAMFTNVCAGLLATAYHGSLFGVCC
jgi:hypothetical protein